jgi:hypothetical protein
MPDADRLTGQLMHLPSIIGSLGLNIAEAQKQLDENYLNGLGLLMKMIKATIGTDDRVGAVLALRMAKAHLKEAELAEAAAAKAHADAASGEKQRLKKAHDAAKARVEDEKQSVALAEKRANEAAGTSVVGDGAVAALEAMIRALAPSRYQYTETTLDFSADLSETKDNAFQVGVGAGFQAVMVSAAFSQAYGYDYRAAARITTKMHAISADAAMTGSLIDRAAAIDADALSLPATKDVDDRIFARVSEVYESLTGAKAKT